MQDEEFFYAADIKAKKQSEGVAIKHALIHAVPLFGILLMIFINPIFYIIFGILTIWILSNVLKKHCPSVEDHARKAMNFYITMLCLIIAVLLSMLGFTIVRGDPAIDSIIPIILAVFIPLFLMIVLAPIRKALKAYNDEEATNYPLAYPFFKRPKL